METVAIILGITLIGTLVGAFTNNKNNDFIDETNEKIESSKNKQTYKAINGR